jgi:AbrB family looped-hinge helix DNA binding protein
MNVSIDSAGRIVLPKPIRERLGLTGGDELEIEETADGVVLRVAGSDPAMRIKQGMWVHTGRLAERADWGAEIERDRQERMEKILGLRRK